MSLTPSRFRQMEGDVARFQLAADDRDHNHARALAEVVTALRRGGDPVEALRLVGALLGSTYARRAGPRVAYTEVFGWLALRLRQAPEASAEALAEEVAWLRRMVMIRQAALPPSMGGRGPAPSVPVVDVAAQLVVVSKARAQWQAAQESAARAKGPAAAAPVRAAPTALPPCFEAEFVDLKAVRDARKVAKEREKAGKAKKVAWVALRPLDASLAGLAKGLSCTLDARGLDALMDDITRRDGRPRSFWVSGVKPEGERLAVGEIALEAPKA